MRRRIPILLTVFFVLVAVGCTSSITSGNALLPEGMAEAKIPELDVAGYLYLRAEQPIALSASRFGSDDAAANGSTDSLDSRVQLSQATLVLDSNPDSFGGLLSFDSERDAEYAWTLLNETLIEGELWGELSVKGMAVVHGSGPWADAVRGALTSENQIAIPDNDPTVWALITNLPENPPSRPIAAGVLKLEGGLLGLLGERAGFTLDGVDSAFGFVRANTVGFGIYARQPLDVSEQIDEKFLINSGTGVLFVSHSDYAGALVSFMVGVAAGRTDMELIEIGDINARYRQIGDLHLILKNRGSLIYAAMAGDMDLAESLILSAMSD